MMLSGERVSEAVTLETRRDKKSCSDYIISNNISEGTPVVAGKEGRR